MLENMSIRVLDSCKTETVCGDGSEIIGLELDILGKPVIFRIAAGGSARLADIVPAARAISAKITDIATEQIYCQRGRIPCHKGCPACCSYLTSLSIPEVFCFNREVFLKPKHLSSHIMRTYLLAASQIIKHRPPFLLPEQSSPDESANFSELHSLSDWYASLNLVCPFMYDNQCVIYQQRPLVCREHFVTGSAQGCKGGHGEAQVVELPVRIANILCQFTRELCAADDAVMIPLALAWYEKNKELDERTWPAVKMVKLFTELVKAAAAKNSTVFSCSS
jgi:Fe-S-cluster containining protein